MIRHSVQEKTILRLIPASTGKNWVGTKLAFMVQNQRHANIGVEYFPLLLDNKSYHGAPFLPT